MNKVLNNKIKSLEKKKEIVIKKRKTLEEEALDIDEELKPLLQLRKEEEDLNKKRKAFEDKVNGTLSSSS